ncbi:MAG: hypothetical protein HQK53_15065, partial [Oligoflexia bacterium]|nr:hypothetical protein [Oligoflexia bacterium]
LLPASEISGRKISGSAHGLDTLKYWKQDIVKNRQKILKIEKGVLSLEEAFWKMQIDENLISGGSLHA